MKLNSKTELMKNQKHADVMSADIAFKVLQTPTGGALFFSIGTDNVFYVTRELPDSSTGWNRLDLSSPLSKPNGGATIKAKAFDISQNLATGLFDIVLAVTINGSDVLYMTRGHSNDPTDWQNQIAWTKLHFDAAGIQAPSPFTIADVYLMNIPSVDDPKQLAVENCFVDIVRAPGNPLQLLDRYYIKPDAPKKWARQNLPIDLKANSISSRLGQRPDDNVPGMYTYGKVENVSQLIYTPQYNWIRPERPAPSARLSLPSGASAIASAPDQIGGTNLFLGASDGLYLFTSDNQNDSASPNLVVPAVKIGKYSLFAGISSMKATTVNYRTVVWLLNNQSQLFYVSCQAGSEQIPGAWSSPLLFCRDVEKFAFYVNNASGNIILFAHITGQEVLQFTQDVAGKWTTRKILLSSTDPKDFVEFNSFTTHAKVTDDHNVGKANVRLELTSDIPVAVYANNVYRYLSPDAPVVVNSDATGAMTIIQITSSISGAKISINLADDKSVRHTADPSETPTNRLKKIQSGPDLDKVVLKDSKGNKRSLVPDGVAAEDKNTVANSITKLMTAKKSLTDSSAKTSKGSSTAGNKAQKALSQPASSTKAASGDTSIGVGAGDLFTFMKTAWNDFEHGVVEFFDDAWHFTVKIANQTYRAVLDTVSAVFQAAEAIFSKIKVFFEDLIAWLGYLFEWDDFVRTHAVIKHALKGKATDAINMLDQIEGAIEDVFVQIEDKINNLTDITDPGETIGTHLDKSSSNALGADSPQSNWAMHHTNNGMDGVDMKGQTSGSDAVAGIINDLEKLVMDEVKYLKTTVDQIKDVVDQFENLTPFQVIKKLIGIVGDLVLKSARSVIVKVIEIAKLLLQGLVKMLDTPIDIPIIGPLYKFYTGADFTVLDVCCLVAAIPATMAFKILEGTAPFPDSASVDRGKSAADAMAKTRRDEQTKFFQSAQTKKAVTPAKKAVLPLRKAATSVKKAVGSIGKSAQKIGGSSAPAVNKQAGAINKSSKDPKHDGHKWDDSDVVVWVLYFIAFPASIGMVIMSYKQWDRARPASPGEPEKTDAQKQNPFGWGAFFFVFYLGFCAPNYYCWQHAGAPVNVVNDIITGISIVKFGLDCYGVPSKYSEQWRKLSPILDMFINFIWAAPLFWGFATSEPLTSLEIVLFVSNVCFDCAGIVAPFTDVLEFPTAAPWVLAGQQLLNFAYGAMSMAASNLWLNHRQSAAKQPPS